MKNEEGYYYCPRCNWPSKNIKAAAAGRIGGLKKGRKGFATMPKERRREIALMGVAARIAKRNVNTGSRPCPP